MVFNNHKNHRMRLVLFLSVPQKRLMRRMCDGEEITVMEATRAFPMLQIKRFREVGLWITANPDKDKNIMMNNNNYQIQKVEA